MAEISPWEWFVNKMVSTKLPSTKRPRLSNTSRAEARPYPSDARASSMGNPGPLGILQGSRHKSVEELSESLREWLDRKVLLVPSDPQLASIHWAKKSAISDQPPVPMLGGLFGLPVEVFEVIGLYLSRDDLLRMRLVNRDFEKKISRRVFRTVVVPFRPNIYGMIDRDTGKIDLTPNDPTGQAVATDDVPPNASGPDGMHVFRSWGAEIRKFALTFDHDKEVYYNLPAKDYFERKSSFWGEYSWPREEYTRYKSCEEKEKKADESHCMALALSHLTALDEFAITVDSGLGWVQGPDSSDRANIFVEKHKIFGCAYNQPDDKTMARQMTWRAIMDEADRNIKKRRIDGPLREGLSPTAVVTTFHSCHKLTNPPWPVASTVAPTVHWGMVPVQQGNIPLLFRGLNLETGVKAPSLATTSYPADHVIPNSLCASQIEWLMEHEWAQIAFLSSLTMAITDTPAVFQNVRVLNLAEVSSRFISAFSGKPLWTSLPNLDTLRMFVIPDWRNIGKDRYGLAVAPRRLPSSAAKQFFGFLQGRIAEAENIRTLDIGWLGGGERAGGLFARNRHILPAPVLHITDPSLASLPFEALSLPHIEHLTLSNCWFHPTAFKSWIHSMSSLKSLKLDSVSLTAPAGPSRDVPIPPQNPNTAFLGIPQAKNILEVLNEFHGYHTETPTVFNFWRSTAPAGGNIEHPNLYQHPSPRESLSSPPRNGSWGEIIDKITPGQTIAQQRHLIINGPHVAGPKPREGRTLKRIEFISCGYVRLPNHRTFIQDDICDIVEKVPRCLRYRYLILSAIMMNADNDTLLGWIAPDMPVAEKAVLRYAFGMRMGWADDDVGKYETREDGQPVGGSGRFSGVVEGDNGLENGEWVETGEGWRCCSDGGARVRGGN